MKSINELMQEIYFNSKIPFELVINDKSVYLSPEFQDNNELIQSKFELNNTKCYINTYITFSISIDLLAFCVKNTLKEIFNNKNRIIYSLLEDENIEEETVRRAFKIFDKEFTLINIYIENNIDNVILDLKECYDGNDVEILKYEDYILIVGAYEDASEHVESIQELISINTKGRIYISYMLVDSYKNIKKVYNKLAYKIELAKKYNLNSYIFDENKLILESIIDSVNEEMKEDVFNRFDKGLSSLDKEMIKTIEVFFKCGLNLSEASKELYIHRNTLIYRLDKIQKYTSYDIRDFNSAVLLKNVFFIWKEKKQKAY